MPFFFNAKNKIYCCLAGDDNIPIEVTDEFVSMRMMVANHFGDQYVRINKRTYCVRIQKTSDVYRFCDEHFGRNSYWITCNGTPVRSTVPWEEYYNGLPPVIQVHPRLRGGNRKELKFWNYTGTLNAIDSVMEGTDAWSKYEISRKFPTPRSQKTFRKQRKFEMWKYEKEHSFDFTIQMQSFTSVQGLDFISSLKNRLDEDIVSLMEDLGLLFIQLARAPTNTDRILSLVTFCKLRSGKSLIFSGVSIIADVYHDLMSFEMQADDVTQSLLDKVTDFRSLLENWESLKDSAIVRKLSKVYKFAIAVGVMSALGIDIDKTTVSICKKEMGFDLFGSSFVVALLDAIALVLQRALMFKQTGEWSTFFHGPKAYGAWYDKCMELKRNATFLSDLETVGTSYHQYVKDLKVAIEQGESILKYGTKTTGVETKMVKTLVNDLMMIQSTVFTYSEAQRSRRPPFSLLVCSNSSLAKSTFVDMLFKYMGQYWNLPATDEYKYPRNSAETYWSGWNSSKWFILLDDIAYINPNRPEPDVSLMEMIQLVNDVPLVPNQAALEDKGRNPVRARAVVATTNIKHLNAHSRFACPLAVQRRLPFVINLEPRPEYARKDSPGMLDPSKLPPIVDDWPDFWLISVERVIDAGDGFAAHKLEHKFFNVHVFLDWLRATMMDFDEVQAKAKAGCNAMLNFKLCLRCNRVKCDCPTMQNRESAVTVELPIEKEFGEPFTKRHEEEGLLFLDIYEPTPGGATNYICRSHVTRGNETLYKIARPVTVVRHKAPRLPMPDEEKVMYADLLSQIIEIQAERAGSWLSHATTRSVCYGLQLYTESRTIRNIVNSAMEWRVMRKLANIAINMMSLEYSAQSRSYYQMLGSLARAAYLTPRWKYALAGIAATVSVAGLYYACKPKQPKVIDETHLRYKGSTYCRFDQAANCLAEAALIVEHDDASPVSQSLPVESSPMSPPVDMQVAREAVPDTHFVKNEKENVWKRDDYEVCKFDMTPLNVEYTKLPFDQLTSLVRRNTARIKVSNGEKVREGNAFCVGGHLWVTNAHTFYKDDQLTVSLFTTPFVEGTGPNTQFIIRQNELYRDEDRDQVWFMVYSWESKRDLRKLVARPTLDIKTKGVLVGYSKSIGPVAKIIDAVVQSEAQTPIYAQPIPAWSGWTREPTVSGDCGMPLLTYGTPCVAIVGLHMMASTAGQVWSTRLDSSMIEAAQKHFDMPILQCRNPELSAPSKEKKLTGLRPWSPLRWVEEGSLKVYGSFEGFQPTPRSKVQKTLLSDIIIRERNWEVDAAVPVMRDWRPWRHALVDVVQQKHGLINTKVLDACARAFADDILEALSPEQLETIQVLSDKATINGIPGVKFIDKMNFKSSIGEPYRKSKKEFLSGPIGDKIFDPEVQERIDNIIKGYDQGICACPVFGGQLKDEVRSKAKVDAGKLRVFLSGAGDWSFVVRKYFLSTVKLIQENPFLFEASPGCAAQSAEWEEYYEFLTQFGFDRLVAGDYGKFDKKMAAYLILKAFWILIQMHKAAGWTDEQCLPLWCIAEDTAYAFCNFGGDLVQFFGSNPSGHPLTVIINCLVNALYMRYCFVNLAPVDFDTGRFNTNNRKYNIARNFKKFVALLTYGDDNTMGVSKETSWFNHTTIQKVLASIGVEYTMADKESESVPYIHIRDVSYLKRRWRWDEDIQAVVCPLEEASIRKMLTWCLPSGEESPEFHMASVMVSAINEWFWYGREIFERERAWLIKLAQSNGILQELMYKGFPTWEQLYDRYWKASEGVITQRSRGCYDSHPRDIVA
nr:MAG: hypothetical protein 1 [Locarnavirus sp.]